MSSRLVISQSYKPAERIRTVTEDFTAITAALLEASGTTIRITGITSNTGSREAAAILSMPSQLAASCFVRPAVSGLGPARGG